MRLVSLFSGVGGFEVGLTKSGIALAALCEIDPDARTVLREHFPKTPLLEDVRAVAELPDCEVLTAGFPCQDLSQAGRTVGIAGARSGLVAEVFRLLARQRVPNVILENVPFMLRLDKGAAMKYLVWQFEQLGYRWAYRVVDARAFGLPQRRERVIFWASLDKDPRWLFAEDAGAPKKKPVDWSKACGFYWTEGLRGLGFVENGIPTLKVGSALGIASPPGVVLPDGDLVTPGIEDCEALQGFPRGWTKTAPAKARWRLVGNAVNTAVSTWIGERLVSAPSALGELTVKPILSWGEGAWGTPEGEKSSVDCSTFPKALSGALLSDYLTMPKALSVRAASGFFERTKRAKIKFPDGFLERVQAYTERLQLAG